jgi:imidazolonepropionase-like amidohydrolase
VGKKGEVTIPDGARVIDARGKTVVPGLIDAHFHMCYPNNREKPFILNESIASFRAAFHLRKHLMGGITTILDAGAYRNVSIMAKQAFLERLLLGSRPIIVAERINATGGHGVSRFPMACEADGPDEFRKAARLQIKNGADVIKILPPYTKEELAAAIEEAHMLKKTVAVHSGYLGNYDYIRWAVELGADVIMHAYALTDEIIQNMGKKGIYGVPTMTIMIKLHATRGNPIPKDRPHEYEIIFQKMKAAGIKMAIGTDAIYEFMNENPDLYFEEVERFVKNGYTPQEAIVAATRIGAEVLEVSDRLGTIEKGKIADLLVIDGDPLDDIRNLRKVSVIIQGGKVIRRGDFK